MDLEIKITVSDIFSYLCSTFLIAMSLRLIRKYLSYLIVARHRNGHGIHSPYLYSFVTQVFSKRRFFYAFRTIEKIRKAWLKNKSVVTGCSFGAGSQVDRSSERAVCDIARNSSVSRKYGELLFRIVEYRNPKTILELGTSLGVSTLYLALPNSSTHVYSIEGCSQLSNLAQQQFKLAGIKNVAFFTGKFESVLPQLLPKMDCLDFVFMDGDHSYEATIAYFNQCLPYLDENTILIVDDIYWSVGMEKAWTTIRNHPSVTVTLDLFSMGIVFFDSRLQKQRFTVIY